MMKVVAAALTVTLFAPFAMAQQEQAELPEALERAISEAIRQVHVIDPEGPSGAWSGELEVGYWNDQGQRCSRTFDYEYDSGAVDVFASYAMCDKRVSGTIAPTVAEPKLITGFLARSQRCRSTDPDYKRIVNGEIIILFCNKSSIRKDQNDYYWDGYVSSVWIS